MRSLIVFEFKKFIRKKKNIISIIVFALLIFLYILLNTSIDTIKTKSVLDSYKLELSSTQDALKNMKSEYSRNDKIPALKTLIEKTEVDVILLNDREVAHLNGNWREELGIQLKLDKQLLEGINAKQVISGTDPERLSQQIAKNQMLYDKNLKPIFEENSMTSFNFLRLVSTEVIPLLLVIVILLLSSDVVSNENDEGTFKFLLTQPISRTKAILSKIIATSIMCLLSVFLILFIFFIGLGIKNGFGSPLYPTRFYTGSFSTFFNNSNNSYGIKLIDIREFILIMLPQMVLLIIAIISMGVLISTIIQNSAAAICTSVIIAVGINVFSIQLRFFKEVVHLIPFTYSNIPGVLSGDLIMQFSNKNVTYLSGIIVLAVFTLICNLSSILIFSKKDITC